MSADQISAEDRATIIELHAAWKANIIQVAKWGWFWYTLVTFGSLGLLLFDSSIKYLWLKFAVVIGLGAAWWSARRSMMIFSQVIQNATAEGHITPLPKEPVSNIVRRARTRFELSRFPAFTGAVIFSPAMLGFLLPEKTLLSYVFPMFVGIILSLPTPEQVLQGAKSSASPTETGGKK